jgi:hypothetical protein
VTHFRHRLFFIVPIAEFFFKFEKSIINY